MQCALLVRTVYVLRSTWAYASVFLSMRPYASWPFGRLDVGIVNVATCMKPKKTFEIWTGSKNFQLPTLTWQAEKYVHLFLFWQQDSWSHPRHVQVEENIWRSLSHFKVYPVGSIYFLGFSNLKLVIFLKGTPNKEAVTVSSVHKDIGKWKTLICRTRVEGSCITSIRILLGSRDHPANQKHIRSTIHEHQLKLELPESRLRYNLQLTSKHIFLLQNSNGLYTYWGASLEKTLCTLKAALVVAFSYMHLKSIEFQLLNSNEV